MKVKARSLFSCILLLILAILLLSTAAQATEYREVKAKDILKQIENGDDVNYNDCHIIGELSVNNLKLKTVPNPYYYKLLNEGYNNERLISYGLSENLSVIESNITITNSKFENSLEFSNVLFNNSVNFNGVIVNKWAYFIGATFNNEVYFNWATFNNEAYFNWANFNNDADFCNANFKDFADFSKANFISSVDFTEVNFNDFADFSKVNFISSVNFTEANFNDSTNFRRAIFNNSANFHRAIFNNNAGFSEANFINDAYFSNVKFNNSVDFSEANFAGGSNFFWTVFYNDADFSNVKFNNSADFSNVKFNNDADFGVPETSENIFTDGKTCEFFRKWYKNEARYTDADNIYYNYRRHIQRKKDFTSPSKWLDILSWVICGYGVRLTHTIYCIIGILLVFSFLYWVGLRDYQLSDTTEKKTWMSNLEPVLLSIRGFTTLGSGDWYSKNNFFRILITVEGLLGWIMLGIFMATLTSMMIRP